MRSIAAYARGVAFGVLTVLSSGCAEDAATVKRTHMENANRYVQQQKYREAIVEYRGAIKLDPKYGEARFKLAQTYLSVGDPRNAYGEAVRAADLLPGNTEAQILAVKLLLLGARFEDAKARIQQVLTAEPRNVTAQILLGNALAGLKEFDQAIAEIQQAIAINPNSEEAYSNLATLQAATGDRKAAEDVFKKVLEVAPRSMDAHLALANYYRTMGRLTDAEAVLKRALELDPNQLLANRALAVFYMSGKRRPEAEPYLKKVVELAKDSASRLALADYYIASKRTADARSLLAVVANDPQSFVEAKTRIASLELSSGSSAAALQAVGQVLAKYPGNATALAIKSRVLLAEHKIDDALAFAEAAVKSSPGTAEAHYAAGLAYVAKQDNARAQTAFAEVLKLNPRSSAAQLALANLHFHQNRFEESAKGARQAMAGQPDDPGPHLLLARVLTAQGDLEHAASELSPLLERYPDHGEVHTRAGMLAIARNDRSAARRSFERALALSPDLGEAFAGLVTLDLADGHALEARAKVESRLKSRPDDSALWLLSAAVSVAADDPAGTERALRKAIDVDPSNLDAYSMLARFYIGKRKLDEARVEFEKVSARQPADVGARTMIGVILEYQGKRAAARTQYEQVIAIDPTAAVAANNLAWMYAEEEVNLDVALQLAQVAVSKLPNKAQVNDTAGWVYYKLGLMSQAMPFFERSMRQAPQNPEFPYHLGLATMQAGDWNKARQLLESALKLNPRFPGADDAKKALLSIQQ